ncbi:hypothetical protein [Shewanella chilikensis]|uniref:hypothetical protein n=1 Tax=Shewanella chilikensis TaxID=558541 RepID=UPI001F2B4025|nr:hypothetical protein [Shewanella chilikensis]MCE9850645.1 hypothetical protein [Shewanella chilikensis]
MKSKELIKILELGQQILSFYEDKDVSYALKDILAMCEQRKLKVDGNLKKDLPQNNLSDARKLRDQFYVETEGLNYLELQAYLEDRGRFPNISSLQQLAEIIGLKGLRRANRDNIVHSIMKAIERSKIDQTISERKTTSIAE